MSQQPQIKYRHDYRAPDYTITDIALDVDLYPEQTRVVATSQVVLQGEKGAALKLDGEGLKLLNVQVDGQAWQAHRLLDDGPGTDWVAGKIHPAD